MPKIQQEKQTQKHSQNNNDNKSNNNNNKNNQTQKLKAKATCQHVQESAHAHSSYNQKTILFCILISFSTDQEERRLNGLYCPIRSVDARLNICLESANPVFAFLSELLLYSFRCSSQLKHTSIVNEDCQGAKTYTMRFLMRGHTN